MKRKNWFLLGSAVAVLALVSAALTFGTKPPSRPKVIVILKEKNSSMTFWKIVQDGVVSGAEDLNLDVDIRGPASEKAVDQQILQVLAAIAEKPRALVLAATDFVRLVPVVQEARRHGIFVVTMDSFIATDDAQAQVGTDSVAMGASAAKSLLGYLKPQALVATLSHIQGSSTSRDREAGARKVLTGVARLLPVVYNGANSDVAYLQTKEILNDHPDLGGIIALNEASTRGAILALRESGRYTTVPLVGIDQSFGLLKALEEGVLRSLLVQQPFNMGYVSLVTVRQLIDGKPVVRNFDTGSIEITKQNMFLQVNEQRLFPFDETKPFSR